MVRSGELAGVSVKEGKMGKQRRSYFPCALDCVAGCARTGGVLCSVAMLAVGGWLGGEGRAAG